MRKLCIINLYVLINQREYFFSEILKLRFLLRNHFYEGSKDISSLLLRFVFKKNQSCGKKIARNVPKFSLLKPFQVILSLKAIFRNTCKISLSLTNFILIYQNLFRSGASRSGFLRGPGGYFSGGIQVFTYFNITAKYERIKLDA